MKLAQVRSEYVVTTGYLSIPYDNLASGFIIESYKYNRVGRIDVVFSECLLVDCQSSVVMRDCFVIPSLVLIHDSQVIDRVGCIDVVFSERFLFDCKSPLVM